MQLEDYFVFLAPDDIRIREMRIGIEHIMNTFIMQSRQKKLLRISRQ
jgi:hypothetical protein